MSAKKWGEIEYAKVPSKASKNYARAFIRNDGNRYRKYLKNVKTGKAKINASAIFPYEILRSALRDPMNIDTYESQWQSLPDYCSADEKSICVCDTSGSMHGLPILVAVSLSIYMAERNLGPFKDHFITFSEKPTLQKIVGSNLVDKYHNLKKASWDMNTNIEEVFRLILKTAVNHKVPRDEMFHKIYIISDMEFDECTYNRNATNFENAKQMFERMGYTLPQLVFWNVDSRHDQSPIVIGDQCVYLVSGCSPSLFRSLMSTSSFDAYSFMLEVLNSERYSCVRI